MKKYLVVLYEFDNPSSISSDSLRSLLDRMQVSSEVSLEVLLKKLPLIIKRNLELSDAEEYVELFGLMGANAECLDQDKDLSAVDFTDLSENNVPMPNPKAVPSFELSLEDEIQINQLTEKLQSRNEEPLVDSVQMIEEVDSSFPDSTNSNSFGNPGLSLEINSEENSTQLSRADILRELEGLSPHSISSMPESEGDIVDGAITSTEKSSELDTPNIQAKPESANHTEVEPKEYRPYHTAYAVTSPSTAPIQDSSEIAFENGLITRKTFKTSHWLVAAGVSLLLVLIALPNMLFNSPVSEVTIDAKQLLKEQDNILAKTQLPQVSKLKAPLKRWLGEVNNIQANTKVELIFFDDQSYAISFWLETPMPQKLTPQEIALGRPFPLWLRRVEGTKIPLNTESTPPKLSFTGNSRAYLEQNGVSERTLVQFRLSLVMDEQILEEQASKKSSEPIPASWVIFKDSDPNEFKENYIIRKGASSVELRYGGELLLLPQEVLKTNNQHKKHRAS